MQKFNDVGKPLCRIGRGKRRSEVGEGSAVVDEVAMQAAIDMRRGFWATRAMKALSSLIFSGACGKQQAMHTQVTFNSGAHNADC